MKILFNKLKKCSKPLKFLFSISLICYTATLIYLTINLLSLSGIETFIRIGALVLFYIFLIGYLIAGLVTIISKKKKTFIFLSIIVLLLSIIFGFVSYYINITYNKVDTISKKYVTYTSNLIAMKDTNENDIEKIGIISNTDDIEGYVLAQEIIKRENIEKDKLEEFDDYYEMLTNLYAGELDAVFISSNYAVSFSTEDLFANIAQDVKVIYEYSKKMENQDILSDETSSKKLTEPFTILLLGVDSEKDGLDANQAFNGDTLMMITFNPNTMNATMFSIPRDTYVPIACRNNAENKINSSAAYGTKCVIDTIENLTTIDIDYYVKVNFKGVVDLVDALDGIEVDVPVSFCEQDSNRLFGDNEICLKPGIQALNGEAALALSRHRKTLPLGDFQRVQHQQLVVEGIAKKAKTVRSVSDFYEILDAISKNIDTNMSTSKMLSFYNVFKKMLTTSLNDDAFITIDRTYLIGNDLSIYNPSTKMNMYTFQYNRNSLKEIVKLMKVNLELEEPEMIKTFGFSINEKYEQYVAGKNVTGGEYVPKNATTSPTTSKNNDIMPNMVGQNVAYAQSWAKARNITLSINYISENDSLYNKNYSNGTIVTQSIAANSNVNGISTLVISVIKQNNSTNNSSSNNNSSNSKIESETEEKDPDENLEEPENPEPENPEPENPIDPGLGGPEDEESSSN